MIEKKDFFIVVLQNTTPSLTRSNREIMPKLTSYKRTISKGTNVSTDLLFGEDQLEMRGSGHVHLKTGGRRTMQLPYFSGCN